MNRIEFSATMIFDEKNFEKAKEIVKGQKVLGHNFNVTEDRKRRRYVPTNCGF